jgi:hypothetical protein
VLLEILLDGVLLRQDPCAVGLSLLHRALSQVVVHDIRASLRAATEQHHPTRAVATVLQLKLIWHAQILHRLRVLAVLGIIDLLVRVVVELEVGGRVGRRHRATAAVVVRRGRVDGAPLARTEAQHGSHRVGKSAAPGMTSIGAMGEGKKNTHADVLFERDIFEKSFRQHQPLALFFIRHIPFLAHENDTHGTTAPHTHHWH